LKASFVLQVDMHQKTERRMSKLDTDKRAKLSDKTFGEPGRWRTSTAGGFEPAAITRLHRVNASDDATRSLR
jgi:hypothetical protein